MSKSLVQSTPFTNPSVLVEHGPLLVENLIIENVLPGLIHVLSHDELDRINAAGERGNKVDVLITCLKKKTCGNSFEALNAFIQLLGGTQPELFTALVGRPPSPSEVDFCVRDITQKLKTEIKQKGHKKDSHLDDEIDLDNQFVQLEIVKDDNAWSSSHDSRFSHEYKLHLEEKEARNENISVCQVLDTREQGPQKVLTMGRAGVGKSTTLQWLARQWALDEWATDFTVLCFLQLRVLTNTNTQMTAIELLCLYGLFCMAEAGSLNLLTSWLQNGAKRVILLIDGIDEVSGFASRMTNAPTILNLNQKANPVDLCMNILSGNLLSGCTIICTSRPFSGLKQVTFQRSFEIIGLTQKKIQEFVHRKHPNRAESIMSELDKNPLLSFVCSITFYCMAVSNLLNDGVAISDEDVQTYTRLTAFILVQLVLRKLFDSPFLLEVGSYFPKLANLAYMGIFQRGEDLSKLVFSENDLREAELTTSDLESIKKVGILRIREFHIGHRNSITAEFLHLSMQELMAIAYLLTNPLASENMVLQVVSGGQFNMALKYLFGMKCDVSSGWITDVLNAVKPPCKQEECLRKEMNRYLENLCKDCTNDSDKKILICQLVHEAQLEDQAKLVANYIAPDGKLLICDVSMTLVDLRAVMFIYKHAVVLELIFTGVNADHMFVNIMLSSIQSQCSKTLQTLDLSSNALSNTIGNEGAIILAKWLKNNTLQTLDVSVNSIGSEGAVALAEGLCCNNTLHTLNISRNSIANEGIVALAEALKCSNTLHTLDISHNNIDSEGVVALAEGLLCSQTLHILNVSYNSIDSEGAVALAEALKFTKTLHTLKVAHNSIASEGAAALAEALKDSHTLHTLDVSRNIIGSEDVVALAVGLLYNNTLDTLNASYNRIGREGAEALAEVLILNNTLHTLNVSYNNIGSEGFVKLAEGMLCNNTLHTMNVSNNRIGREGAEALAEVLILNNTLHTLNVSYNNIGSEGVVKLAEGLLCNNTLHTMNVSNNKIGREGAEALAEVLNSNKTLHTLNVSYNNIDSEGVVKLAEGLLCNTILHTMNVSNNSSGDKGAEAIAEALKCNNTLHTLNVSSNSIDHEGAVALAEALNYNTTLHTLDVSLNSIGSEGVVALAEVVKSNNTLHTLHVT